MDEKPSLTFTLTSVVKLTNHRVKFGKADMTDDKIVSDLCIEEDVVRIGQRISLWSTVLVARSPEVGNQGQPIELASVNTNDSPGSTASAEYIFI